jgi:6-pyruvoyltetrahydropterin/6-carboxytetrahydropterin synthase
MAFQSTKTYGNHVGISAAFRQWKAHSHCRFVHGYALGFKFIFEADELDQSNWVVDFGGLKPLKAMLENTFDHKVVVAEDDPHLDYFKQGEALGVLELVVVPSGGCEKFAELVYECTEQWLKDAGFAPRCRLVSVEVFEHGANSAIFTGH